MNNEQFQQFLNRELAVFQQKCTNKDPSCKVYMVQTPVTQIQGSMFEQAIGDVTVETQGKVYKYCLTLDQMQGKFHNRVIY